MDPVHQEGIRFLCDVDADFVRAVNLIKPIPPRDRPEGFEALARIIVEQQLSLASAAAIWGRLSSTLPNFTPEALLSLDDDALRSCGLSRPKMRYCRALAEDVLAGTVQLEQLPNMPDEEVAAHLMQVKGIGRWTSEIYLISCLNRPDVLPAGDIALQIAFQHLKELEARPSPDELTEKSRHLSPHRTLAARILWRYYMDVAKPPKNNKKLDMPA